jgi:hypothetical protein
MGRAARLNAMPRCQPAILTYHSQNIAGHEPATNDHAAFAQDLETLTAAGLRIVPLGHLLDWLEGLRPEEELHGTVCITLDDGCDFDVRDLEWPGVGQQRSMLGIMRDFIGRHGPAAQPGLHATSFVIACPEAREVIDRGSLFGQGWMNEDWWPVAAETGLLAIGNHGWDHNHPDLAASDGPRGGFASVDNREACEAQVVRAARYIEQRCGTWPDYFAYPFGESSSYIRETYFPERREQHRCRAAFGTEPGPVTPGSDRWNLPRYVCRRDWRSAGELLGLVNPV